MKNIFPHHGYIWNYGAFPQVSGIAFAKCTLTKTFYSNVVVSEIGEIKKKNFLTKCSNCILILKLFTYENIFIVWFLFCFQSTALVD